MKRQQARNASILRGNRAAMPERLEGRDLLAFDFLGNEAILPGRLTGDQVTSFDSPQAVAMMPGGGSVVSWTDYGIDRRGEVMLRRFDAQGAPLGPEINVSRGIQDRDSRGVVAVDAQGDILVVWSSLRDAQNSYDVYARRYSAALQPLGAEFRVNETVIASQSRPAVDVSPEGDAVIVWASDRQDGNSYGVYARKYRKATNAASSEIAVNTRKIRAQTFPSVAMDSAGEFIVAWTSDQQDGDGLGVYAKSFDSLGVSKTPDVKLTTATNGSQLFPSIDVFRENVFVTWSTSAAGNFDVAARVFRKNLTPLTSEFLVHDASAGLQYLSDIAATADGGFVVAWSENLSGPSGWEVKVRNFDANFKAVTGELTVNQRHQDAQMSPSLDWGEGNGGMVVFTSRGGDNSGQAVMGRMIVDNVAPLAKSPRSYAIDEGDALKLDASDSTDANAAAGDAIVSYLWDLNQDGDSDFESTEPLVTIPWGTLASQGIDDGDVTYNLTLTVVDKLGAKDTTQVTLSVRNTPPSARLTGVSSQAANQMYRLGVSAATDPGADTVTAYLIDWGDSGQPTTATGAGTFLHRYAAGSYTIRLTLVDEDGIHQDVVTKQVRITAAAPLAPALLQMSDTPRSAMSFSIATAATQEAAVPQTLWRRFLAARRRLKG